MNNASPSSPSFNRNEKRDRIAEAIVASLKNNADEFFAEIARRDPPHNPVTKTRYQGFNWLSLNMAMREKDSWDGRFMTFNNIVEVEGWKLQKGSTSSKIIFAMPRAEKYSRKDKGTKQEAAKTPEGPVLLSSLAADAKGKGEKQRPGGWITREYSVFHASQIDGIPSRPSENAVLNDATCDLVLEAMKADGLRVVGRSPSVRDDPCYVESLDAVYIPPKDAFKFPGAFYASQFHELAHATGHKSRLDRFSTEKYAPATSPREATDEEKAERKAAYHREEFVAEIASAMLCAELGVPDHDKRMTNTSAYISGYLKLFAGNPAEVFHASTKAKSAVDFTLKRTIEYAQKIGVLEQHPKLAEIMHREQKRQEARAERSAYISGSEEPAEDQAEEPSVGVTVA